MFIFYSASTTAAPSASDQAFVASFSEIFTSEDVDAAIAAFSQSSIILEFPSSAITAFIDSLKACAAQTSPTPTSDQIAAFPQACSGYADQLVVFASSLPGAANITTDPSFDSNPEAQSCIADINSARDVIINTDVYSAFATFSSISFAQTILNVCNKLIEFSESVTQSTSGKNRELNFFHFLQSE
jgi:hypothetical protein